MASSVDLFGQTERGSKVTGMEEQMWFLTSLSKTFMTIDSIIVLCVPRLMSSVHEMDCLREETVPVSGRSGAQSSVALTRR